MAQIRSTVDGAVVGIDVDEGQMVAEEDTLAVVDTAQGTVSLVTEIPGVVRELYVQPGHVVAVGDPIALIDES